ncbi:MAG: Unknown protein, partial [uncultured Sulfurovum sp.]
MKNDFKILRYNKLKNKKDRPMENTNNIEIPMNKELQDFLTY